MFVLPSRIYFNAEEYFNYFVILKADASGSTDNQQNGSEEGKGYEMRGYGYSDDTV